MRQAEGSISSHHSLHDPSSPVPQYTAQHDKPQINPRTDTPPNFNAPGYDLVRQALIVQNQDNEVEQDDYWAAKQLLDAWEADGQARQVTWDEAAAQEERERVETEVERLGEDEKVRTAEKKKKARFPPIIRGALAPKDSGFRPCEKAISRLKSREVTEPLFFPFAGCQITKDAASANEDGTQGDLPSA